MTIEKPIMTPGEYAALRVRRRYTPSQWAEAYRYLDKRQSAYPGRWRNDRVPYLAGIMDTIDQPHVRGVVVLKPTQVGFSEMTRCMLGYWIDNDPDDILITLPDNRTARKIVDSRIKPLLDEPNLKIYRSASPYDETLDKIKLSTMSIRTAWAGSPSSLAADPIAKCIFDEVDKYPPFAGREADPIRLGLKRMDSYRKSKFVIGSTPTTRAGNVYVWWERCGDQRYFWVPCPHCGGYQKLEWGHVKWPRHNRSERLKEAERIARDNLAFIECIHCNGEIRDIHKRDMLKAGLWVGSDQVITEDGQLAGPDLKSRYVGFHLNSLYSPFLSISALAAEFLSQLGDPAALMDFRNSRLAEPFEDQRAKVSSAVFEEKIETGTKRGVVPRWCTRLIVTADTQSDHFYYVVRAWTNGFKSQLVAYGRCDGDFTDLERLLMARPYPVEGGGEMVPDVMFIDSGGDRTVDVYGFIMNSRKNIIAVKGASHASQQPCRIATMKKNGVRLALLQTGELKDELHRLVNAKESDRWRLFRGVGDDYVHQMTSEHKIYNARKRKEEWVQVTGGRDNHYWDCEVYQVGAALAWDLHVEPQPDDVSAKRPAGGEREYVGEDDFDSWATGYQGRW